MKKPLTKKNTKEKKPVTVEALSAPIYTMAGTEAGTVALPADLFGAPWNNDLVRQVALSMMSNARAGRGQAHTKDRGEVRGGGKKPWKQKGTGRARHGSSRSPIWIGGGVTHGPRADKDYSKRIPRTMRTRALAVALSRKFRDGEILFVDSLSFDAPKTADARKSLVTLSSIKGFEQLAHKKANAVFIALADANANAKRSFANFGNVVADEVRNLNVVDILSAKYLLIEQPENALALLMGKIKKDSTQMKTTNAANADRT